MDYRFDWDPDKDIENQRKYGVAFTTAIQAFYDPHYIITHDPAHSIEENRYFCYGKIAGAVLTIRFTYRATRFVLSAQRIGEKERKYMPKKIVYEDNPWPDVKDFDIKDFKVVKDLLPPPEAMRNAEVYVNGKPFLLVPVSKKDMRVLQNRAKHKGISSRALAAAVLHAFVDHTS